MQSITIGMDVSKSVFQLHGVDEEGAVVVQKRLRRSRLLDFFSSLPPCLVALEACASAHHWGRELVALGHEVRLIPPAYVKPYVKRGKTDAADAEAICEAVLRPSMRFVGLKSCDDQAAMSLHRTRSQLVRQRTQLINLLRSQMAEFGLVAPQGMAGVITLVASLEDTQDRSLPGQARFALGTVARQIAALTGEIKDLEKAIRAHAKSNDLACRLQTIPGIGPITASALVARVPDAAAFISGRHFAAWLGLTPKAHDSGLKHRRGPISKMGDRYLRQLLVIGATSTLRQVHKKPSDPLRAHLSRLMKTKPARLATVAAANKCARIIWAMMKSGETYRLAG